MRILIAFLLLFAVTIPAQASTQAPHFSGTELQQMCSSKYDTDYGYCAGYVSAVANLLLTESVAGFRACNLEPVKSQQFIDIFQSYAELFQSNLGGEAKEVVAAALARAFPCGQ